jgi:ABC-type lipoprotein release transport system permease subunit
MRIDLKMAWRNIWRNRRRSILTILAIAFACLLLVFMLSFQFGSYADMIRFSLRIHTGHLQIKAEGYQKDKNIRKVVSDPGAVAEILRAQPRVSDFTFRSNAFSLLSSKNRTYGVMISGIDPVREARVTTIKNVIRRGKYLTAGDNNQTIIGKLLAENLKAGVGDELVLLGQARDGSVAASMLTVTGIFSSGEADMDRSLAFITLDTFNRLFFMRGAVHEVVALCQTLNDVKPAQAAVQRAVDGIDSRYPLRVWNWEELIPGLLQGIKIDFFSGIIFYLIMVIVVAFSILNTFLMAVFERTREFGVMLALGVTHGRLTRLLLLESTFLCIVGMAVGITAGALVTLYFQQRGIHISGAADILKSYGLPEVLRPRLSWVTLISGPAVVFVVTFLTALYPALRARLLKPAEAMHAV